MVRCSDCALSCKACAFQCLFAGSSSDIWSFWPIHQNPDFTTVPVKSPTYWTEPETSPFLALHICTEIHAALQFYTHRSLWSWRSSWRRWSRATRTDTAAWGPGLKAMLGPFWQIPKLQNAAIQTMEWDSPGPGSSLEESQQCPVAFAVSCDLAPGANLVPPLPGPCQLDALPLCPQERWSSLKFLRVQSFIQSK